MQACGFGDLLYRPAPGSLPVLTLFGFWQTKKAKKKRDEPFDEGRLKRVIYRSGG